MWLSHNRIKETSTSTGTGNLTLAGAVTQFSSFISRYATDQTFIYCIEGQTGSEWEVGYGWLSNSTTLVRWQVYQSSNADAIVSFSAGTKNVFQTVGAHTLNALGETGVTVIDFGEAPGSDTATEVVIGVVGISSGTATVNLELDSSSLYSALRTKGQSFTYLGNPALGEIQDIKFGAGLYVILFKSTTNVIATTTDFITFTPRTNGLGSLGYALLYKNGRFIATGTAGALCTSTDGITWTTQTSSFGTSIIYGLEWMNGFGVLLFFAVGEGGKVATSPTGVTWTQVTTLTTETFTGCVTKEASGYVVLCGDKEYITDGTYFSVSTSPFVSAGGSTIPRTIYHNPYKNHYLLLSSPNLYYTPESRIDFTDKTLLASPTTATITSVVYGNGNWLALCSNNTILKSLNGLQWYPTEALTSLLPGLVVGATGKLMYTNTIVFLTTTSGLIYQSPDTETYKLASDYRYTKIQLFPGAITNNTSFTINAVSDERLTGTYTVRWSWRN